MKFYKKVDDYYKSIKSNMDKKLDNIKEFQYNFGEDNTVEIIADGKMKMKAEYSVIGMYHTSFSTFYWGWSLDFVNKSLVKNLDMIKKFPIILEKDKTQFDTYELEELYFFTSNNSFYCSGENLDKIIRFVLFMAEGIFWFPVKLDGGIERIEYILLTKILQIN